MELEEAVKKLKKIIAAKWSSDYEIALFDFGKYSETVLQALENKNKKIEDKIEELDNEFNNYQVDVNCSQADYYELSDKYAFAKEKLKELLEDK